MRSLPCPLPFLSSPLPGCHMRSLTFHWCTLVSLWHLRKTARSLPWPFTCTNNLGYKRWWKNYINLLHLILLLQRCWEIYTTEILCLKSCRPVTHSKCKTIELSKQHTKHCDGRNSHPLLWRIPVQGVTNRPCEASSDPCCLNFCSKRLYRDRSPTMQRE